MRQRCGCNKGNCVVCAIQDLQDKIEELLKDPKAKPPKPAKKKLLK